MDDVLIHNTCAHERIESRLRPLIDAARDGLIACCGDRIREIRLQGSIARGEAQVGLADLDMIALLDSPPTERDDACLTELAAKLSTGTTLVPRFDLEALDANALEPFRRFVLSSDSLCIHGPDSLTLPVQALKRLDLARLVTPDPQTMLPDCVQWTEELTRASDAQRRFASRIIGKDLLKVLRGVLLLRGAPYEVAIPRIASQVCHFAPEATHASHQLFALYSEPVNDAATIRRITIDAVDMLNACEELGLLPNLTDATVDYDSEEGG